MGAPCLDFQTGETSNLNHHDATGKVQTIISSKPNGIQTTLNYDSMNRLTSLTSPIASYTYTLGATGIRTGATESNGRAITWNYDGIYRLTNETVSSDPSGNNGASSYGLDPVGNRLSLASTLTGELTGNYTFNADDEISSESYDANGNVILAGGITYTYDSQNHMLTANGNGKSITMIYDGDGNRVSKTVNGVTTQYLVDDLNPTGYAQVVEELVSGAVTRQYTYGLQRISENQQIANVWTPSFYEYDGFGSVRQLTNAAGTVTDEYEYDAFGNSFTKAGTTPNNYLYRGEQYDSDLGLYYLRARYYNPNTGRFMSRDPLDGKAKRPASLHKYLYANGDPVNMTDPRGRESMLETGSLDALIAEPALPALTALTVGAAAWAATATEVAAEIAAELAIEAADAAAGEFAAAADELVTTVNEFNALMRESSLLGALTRALACADGVLLATQIVEHEFDSPKLAVVVDFVGGVVCYTALDIRVVHH